jgi:hypothetical protein
MPACPLITSFQICDPGMMSCVSSGTKTVNAGAPIDVYWNSANTTNCVAMSGPGFNTNGSTSGVDSANANAFPSQSDAYTLMCRNDTGVSVNNTITVATNPGPILSVSSRVIAVDSNVSLLWETKNGNEALCTLTGGELINNPLDPTNTDVPIGDVEKGSITVSVKGRTTYVLTCPNGVDTAMVEIMPVGFES